jgi:hypothetical protein
MAKGRPRKSGPRNKSGRLLGNVEPCERVQEKRALFGFVRPEKGPEGRGGTIDEDIWDGIGQLHALGLLETERLSGKDLRDYGRTWRDHYVTLLRRSGFKTGSYERMDKSTSEARVTARDLRFDEADERLKGRPRSALLQLLVDPLVGSYPDNRENVWWCESVIAKALLERRILPPRWMQPIFWSPEAQDWLEQAIEGLVMLAGEQQRRMAA